MTPAKMRTPPIFWLAAVGAGLLVGIIPWLAQGNPLLGLLLLGGALALIVLVLGWPFSAVALLIVTALFTRFRFDIGPLSVRAEHVAVLAVLALGAANVLVQRGRVFLPPAAWFAGGWWLANLISALWFSPDRAIALQNAFRILLMVLTFVLVLNLIPNRRHWWAAVLFFLAAGVAEAAFGTVARALYPFGVNLGVQVAWNFTEPIPYGTFEEGNLFGSHTAAWAIALLMLVLTLGMRRRRWAQMAGLGALLVLLVGLFLSLSRAAWLTFLVGAALVWILHRPQPWHQVNRSALALTLAPLLVVGLLGMALVLPAHWPFIDRLQSFLNLTGDATFSARLSDWSLAIRDWLQQPWTGWGPGSFTVLHGLLRANPAWISNLGLRLLQETGILGLITFIGFLITLILPALKVALRQRDPIDRAGMLGMTISYVVLIGLAYQSTDGIWLAASWVHAGLIAAGTRVLAPSE